MLRFRQIAILASAAFLMNGCVALDKYNALKLDRDQAVERVSQAESEARAEREKAKILQDQLNALLANGGENQNQVQVLMKQNADLKAEVERLNKLYQDALAKAPVIPQDVSNQLADLAAQYPELLVWDPTRGMLKFKSDVTFASGSAELTPKAIEVLKKVSTILNSPSIAGYDFLVAGHTDSVPVSQPRTIQAGHKDNWYLSAHRAISVGGELRKAGTSASRLGVLGYADTRPVASNATVDGKAQNRRVEILIVAGHSGEQAPAAKATPAVKAAPVEKAPAVTTPEINK